MKKSEKEASAIRDALESNDLIAEVIKFSAVWEVALDRYLAIEFGGANFRFDDFIELIIPSMSFAQKIDTLKKMRFRSRMKSHANIISSLTRIRKIRNKVAHVAHMGSVDIKKLQSDRQLVAFILDYPESFRSENETLKNSFSHLWRSWEVHLKKERVYWSEYIAKNPEGYQKFLP